MLPDQIDAPQIHYHVQMVQILGFLFLVGKPTQAPYFASLTAADKYSRMGMVPDTTINHINMTRSTKNLDAMKVEESKNKNL
jgi:hypothetical protein